MRDFIVISYFTRNTEYERAAMRLIESLDKLNIPHHVQGIDNLGSWDLNTHYKAQFILEMMAIISDKDIVFLDADAIVHKYPKLFCEIEEDCAAYYYQDRQLASGTLYFKNNLAAQSLVLDWVIRNRKNPRVLEQQNLQESVYTGQGIHSISFKKLPGAYCKIFDLMDYVEDPVIEHFQLSRMARAEVSMYAQEKQKYSDLWQGDYQPSRCALPLVKYVMKNALPGWKMLDIGCGNSATVRALRAQGYQAHGCDITLCGVPDRFRLESILTEAPIWNMPFADGEFDFTFSTDVLEHIPPAMVKRSIKEILRVTKHKTFHCIANFSDVRNGQEMHLSQHAIDRWADWFREENIMGRVSFELIDRKEFLQIPEYQIKGGEII